MKGLKLLAPAILLMTPLLSARLQQDGAGVPPQNDPGRDQSSPSEQVNPPISGRSEHSPSALRPSEANRPEKSSDRSSERSDVTLPSGTVISVRVTDDVDSHKNHVGELITGSVDPSVLIDDHVVIPRGTEAHMRLTEDEKGGRLLGKASVRLELVALVIHQEKVDVNTNDYEKSQSALSSKLKDEAKASGNAGASAAVSATPEGGAVGPIIAIFRSAKIELHSGTRIPFTLTTPFVVEEHNPPPA
jgi:hypothetical protein